jgi:replicative DNA helicase
MAQTYNEALEISVLSCLLRDGSLFPIVEDVIEKKSFGWTPFGNIYQSIKDIINSDLYPDSISVQADLDRKGLLDGTRVLGKELVGKDAIDYIRDYKDCELANLESYAYQLQAVQATRQLYGLKDKFGDMLEKGESPYQILSNLDIESGKIASFIGFKSNSMRLSNDVAKESVERFSEAVNGHGRYISTGINGWDDFVGGLAPQKLYMVAAYSSDGKSALLEDLVYNVAVKQGIKVFIMSGEMSSPEVNNRLVQIITGISPVNIDKGKLLEGETVKFEDAIKILKDAPIIYDDSSEIILAMLRTKIRKAVAEGAKLVVIDQLENLMIGGTGDAQAEHIRLNHIAYRVKAYCRENDIPIVIAHQTNRSSESGQNRGKNLDPQMADVNQAGEKPCDAILIIKHFREGQEITESWFHWVKNRFGRKGKRKIGFDGPHIKFYDLPTVYEVPEFVQDEFHQQ